jgi:hypothetical protein
MSTGVSQPVFDDDENTEPSSANNSQQAQQPYPQGVDPAVVAGSFARFLETTRRRLSSGAGALGAARGGGGRGPADSEEDDAMLDATDAVLIAGYLQKLGRNGKWQTRWFETDGECLSYYKSSKRNKLLATLDLAKVRVARSLVLRLPVVGVVATCLLSVPLLDPNRPCSWRFALSLSLALFLPGWPGRDR